jgi:hypothetical protein
VEAFLRFLQQFLDNSPPICCPQVVIPGSKLHLMLVFLRVNYQLASTGVIKWAIAAICMIGGLSQLACL